MRAATLLLNTYEDTIVTTRTVTALFDSRDSAERVRSQLLQLGTSDDAVQIVDQSYGRGMSNGDDHKGFWESIKDFFVPDEDRSTYTEGLRRGGYLLTARVDDAEADQAMEIIEASDAIDLDTRSKQWQTEGWTGYPSSMSGSGMSSSAAAAGLSADRVVSDDASEQAIPVVEERLRVGKREVNRGGVRVRSYIVETPVHEDVQLREERVEVERRPVNDRAAAGDLLQERTIEATESAEEAVVAKEAVVTEEVVVKKFSGERTKGVDETVRRTEVDVDDTRAADRNDLDDVSRPPTRGSRSSSSRTQPRK